MAPYTMCYGEMAKSQIRLGDMANPNDINDILGGICGGHARENGGDCICDDLARRRWSTRATQSTI